MWILGVVFILIVWFTPNVHDWFGIDFQLNNRHVPPVLFESFSGGLLANKHLSKADKLFVGELNGPECFAQKNGQTYASTGDGRIVELLSDSYRTVVHLDPNRLGLEACRQIRNSGRCARPLGIKFDSNGILFAVDPYNGLHRIDVDSGVSSLILNITKTIVDDGSRASFLDDLEIVERPGRGHLIYLSDASQKWQLYDVANVVSEAENSGRLLSFDMDTNQLSVVMPDLAFPNGLQLTDDRSAIILCIFIERRLVKYHLSTGKITHFVDLPGEPDNVKRSKDPQRETYLVGLYTARNRHNPNVNLDTFATFAGLKRFGFRMTRAIGYIIQEIGKFLEMPELENMGFFIKIGGPVSDSTCKYGMIVEIDSTGKIVNSLHSPDGQFCTLSEAYEYENSGDERKFYLGSYSNNYLGRLVLPKSAFNFEKKAPVSTKTSKKPNKTVESQQKVRTSTSQSTAEGNSAKQASSKQQQQSTGKQQSSGKPIKSPPNQQQQQQQRQHQEL